MNDYIEQLAVQKSFAELNPDERAAVLCEMTSEYYDQIRVILLAAPVLDKDQEPPLALRQRLLERLPARAPAGFRQKPAPLWAALSMVLVAALLSALVTAWLLQKGPANIRPDTAPVAAAFRVDTLLRVDTLYLPRIEWRERIVWRERVVYRTAEAAQPVAESMFPPLFPSADTTRLNLPEQRTGTSLANQPELMEFFIKVD